MTPLQDRLLAAHRTGDKAALVTLYCEAAQSAPTPDAAGFFRTHAYVFALDHGDPRSEALRAALQAEGREP